MNTVAITFGSLTIIGIGIVSALVASDGSLVPALEHFEADAPMMESAAVIVGVSALLLLRRLRRDDAPENSDSKPG